MRISDWSSDVCSSDLFPRREASRPSSRCWRSRELGGAQSRNCSKICPGRPSPPANPPPDPNEDRKSVVSGKSVSVRVDLGGRRIIKNKQSTPEHPDRIPELTQTIHIKYTPERG